MKVFTMLFDEEVEGLGVYALSVVNNPAMKQFYVALSEDETYENVFLSVQDAEKRILTGAVMVPDLPITRLNKTTKEPYQIEFPAETIELASQNFMENFAQSSITAEHKVGIEGCTVVETWLKTSENDKSLDLGIDAPIGSWLVTLKVDNDELWDDYIATGLFRGFSIEGHFKAVEKTEEVQLKEIKMTDAKTEKSIIGKIKALLGMEHTETVELESKVAEVSHWWTDVVNDTFELDTQIMRKPYEEGGEPSPISAGEYTLEDGRRVLVDKEGYIRYIFDDKKSTPEPETEPAKAETEPETETVEASAVAEPVEAVVDPETPNAAPESADVKTVVEAPSVTEPTLEDVKEVLKEREKEEVPMIAHTDAQRPSAAKGKLKFDHSMTVAERIKASLEHNLN